MSPPERIFLQWHGPGDPAYEGITWASDKINDDDVEYVLVEKVEPDRYLEGFRDGAKAVLENQP